MSTSPTFVCFGNWPSDFCGYYPTSLPYPDSNNFPYYPVGPFTLEQAMNLIWNAESLHQTSPFDTVSATYGGSVTPNQRICVAVSLHTSASHGGNGPTMVEMNNSVYTDGYGNYFLQFNAMAVTVDTSGNEWTIWNYPYPFPNRYFDHTFTGTIAGKSVTFYCYHQYASGSTAWPFTDSMSVSVSYWTY